MENSETIEVADNAGRIMSKDNLPDDASGLAILYRLTDRLYRAADLQSALDAALDAITEGLQCTKCSVLLFDDDAVMRFVAWRGLTDHYRSALEGHTPWTLGTLDPSPIFVPDIEDTDEPQHVRETISREGIRSLAFIPITSQGKVVGKFMTYHAERRVYTAHARALAVTIARQLGFSIERARYEEARVKALRELQDSEVRFRQMAEHAPVMIWMSDANGACLHLNRMLREFWSVTEDGIGNFDWRNSMHPDDHSPCHGKDDFRRAESRKGVRLGPIPQRRG